MTKNLDIIDAQETTLEEVGDSLKAWLAGGKEDAPEGTEEPQEGVSQVGPQEDAQEPAQEPEEDTTQDDTADSPEAAEGPEDTPKEDTEELGSLEEKYAALQARLAELEAREAARLEAQEKTNALTEAGIKGDYSALLNGPKDQWAGQIALLKEFAAENGRAVSVPRDPAVDADVWSEPKEISAEEFLRSRSNEW
jgi:hypothetical protein